MMSYEKIIGCNDSKEGVKCMVCNGLLFQTKI